MESARHDIPPSCHGKKAASSRFLGDVRSFASNCRPTGMICHGPISLLSTLPDAKAFEGAMVADDLRNANKLAADWPYAGYRLTVLSSTEELLAVSQFGGHPKYSVSDALSQAGAHVDRLGAATQRNFCGPTCRSRS
ncbi:hypothetical protein [Burkholderia sp. PU8-34]